MQITPALILACLAGFKTVSAMPFDNADSVAERSVNEFDTRAFEAELYDMERRDDGQDLHTREFYETLITRGLEELDARELQEEFEARGLFGLASKAASIGGKAIGLGNLFSGFSSKRELPQDQHHDRNRFHGPPGFNRFRGPGFPGNRFNGKRPGLGFRPGQFRHGNGPHDHDHDRHAPQQNQNQKQWDNKPTSSAAPSATPSKTGSSAPSATGSKPKSSEAAKPSSSASATHHHHARAHHGHKKHHHQHHQGHKKQQHKGQRKQYPVDPAGAAPAPQVNAAPGMNDPTVGRAAPQAGNLAARGYPGHHGHHGHHGQHHGQHRGSH